MKKKFSYTQAGVCLLTSGEKPIGLSQQSLATSSNKQNSKKNLQLEPRAGKRTFPASSQDWTFDTFVASCSALNELKSYRAKLNFSVRIQTKHVYLITAVICNCNY